MGINATNSQPNMSDIFGCLLKSGDGKASADAQKSPKKEEKRIPEKIHQDKSTQEIQNQAKPDIKLPINRSIIRYSRLKKMAEKASRKNAYDGSASRMQDWLMEERPVVVLPVTNDMTGQIETEMKNRLMPFIRVRKFKKTEYVLRECDQDRLQSVIDDVMFRMRACVQAFDYELFERNCQQEEITVTYFTNLTELQMEFIRRNITENNCSTQYSMFRMNKNRWGLGIEGKDFLSYGDDINNPVCFAESWLYSAIALSGVTAEEREEQLSQDVESDRSVSIRCSLGLQNNNQVYIFDPENPHSALAFEENGFRRCEVTGGDLVPKVKQGPLILYNEIGNYILYDDLLGMMHKDTVYTPEAFLERVREWKYRNKEERAKTLSRMEGERLLAHIIYLNFAERNKQELWFQDTARPDIMVKHFREEMISTLDSISRGTIPVFYTERQSEMLINLIKSCDLPIKNLKNAITLLRETEIRALSKEDVEGGKSLREIIRDIDVEHPEKLPEIALEQAR